MVYSILAGAEVDSGSETWRHETECKWLLTNKPTRSLKHRWLYGVDDRRQLFRSNPMTGQPELRDNLNAIWGRDDRGRQIKPIIAWRGLEAADRMLADAKKIYDHQNGASAA